MYTRITADQKDIRLVQLIEMEAIEKGISRAEVLVQALEAYFAEKLENLQLVKASNKAFAEWDNDRDASYDLL